MSSWAADVPEQLSATLKTDKWIYRPHDEITFTETLRNCGNETIQIYDDTCYYGADMKFKRVSDGKDNWERSSSCSHTVKPGLRPSRRVFLKSREKLTRTFSAYVTDDFRVAFQNHGSSAFTGFSSGKVETPGLPQKYIGCGHIFNLEKPGLYEVSCDYINDTQWSNGEIPPKQPAWIGRAKSNEVPLELKKP